MMLGTIAWAVAEAYGVSQGWAIALDCAIVGTGNLVVSGYIWLASRNTSHWLYTWLARGSVIGSGSIQLALLFWFWR